MKKKKIMIVGSIVLILLSVIGITMAYLSTGSTQSLANTFTSGCLNINIESESSAITLTNIYPITDVEGLDSDAYTFTIRNNCSEATKYQVNLESLNETANSLNANYLKVALESDSFGNIITKLGSDPVVNHTITGSYESHEIYKGEIAGNSIKTYSLRMWMDYDTTKEQGANKTFTSKINVIANPNLSIEDESEITYKLSSLNVTGIINGSASSAKYCITKENKCTPNQNATISNNKIELELLEDKVNKQVVCISLDNKSAICSKPYLAKQSDFNMIAMYQQKTTGSTDNSNYDEITTMPSTGYVINESKSYCNVNGVRDNNAVLETYNGRHTIANLQKESNCYVYFDIDYEQLVNYQFLYDGSLRDATANQITSVTGGYDTYTYAVPVNSSFNRTSMTVSTTADVTGSGIGFYTKNNIDMTDYTYTGAIISFEVTKRYSGGYSVVMVSTGQYNKLFVNLSDQLLKADNAYFGVNISAPLEIIHGINLRAINQGWLTIHTFFIAKADDYNTLASKINVTVTDIDDLLNNYSTQLLNNKDAVRYMVKQCTGEFMVKALTNSTFKAAYQSSPYKSLIDSNEHWSKFISLHL